MVLLIPSANQGETQAQDEKKDHEAHTGVVWSSLVSAWLCDVNLKEGSNRRNWSFWRREMFARQFLQEELASHMEKIVGQIQQTQLKTRRHTHGGRMIWFPNTGGDPTTSRMPCRVVLPCSWRWLCWSCQECCGYTKVKWSCSVMSNSLRPHVL